LQVAHLNNTSCLVLIALYLYTSIFAFTLAQNLLRMLKLKTSMGLGHCGDTVSATLIRRRRFGDVRAK